MNDIEEFLKQDEMLATKKKLFYYELYSNHKLGLTILETMPHNEWDKFTRRIRRAKDSKEDLNTLQDIVTKMHAKAKLPGICYDTLFLPIIGEYYGYLKYQEIKFILELFDKYKEEVKYDFAQYSQPEFIGLIEKLFQRGELGNIRILLNSLEVPKNVTLDQLKIWFFGYIYKFTNCFREKLYEMSLEDQKYIYHLIENYKL